MLSAPVLTFAFLGVVIALGAAFIWMFWEIEQAKIKPRREVDPLKKTFLEK